MVWTLESFSEGKWRSGEGEQRQLLDAATGELVANAPVKGPDIAAMLEYARSVGGPAIRALTFAERAGLLRMLAKHLLEGIDNIVEVSVHTGATRRDTAVDVDGGFGTLAVYASLAAKGLPDATAVADGGIEPLGRGGTFGGRHIFTTRLGAAVQINAFNFPVWGMLEKFAPAFLAGMPSVVKPATQTSYLTELVVRRIIESDILPEGAISLLCGAPGDLIENLTAQDTLSFTGSAETGLALRTNRNLALRSVAFNAEADSLNCSILGDQVEVADEEFSLFVDQVVTEMTVKAGQKCTAIRRVFVPERLVAEVTDALTERLDAVTIGHPANADVDMGPLASLDQRAEVQRAVSRINSEAEVVFGAASPHLASDLDGERGAFVSPVLLRAPAADVATPHEVEAFGPVATLLPYRSRGDVIDAAARGDGSLVCSIVSADPEFAKKMINGLAPWHGRLLVLDATNAAESTGHGVAMPQMLHGGPGRAGGGKELGGLRALHLYFQHTAVQGHPDFLEGLVPEATSLNP